MATVIRVKRKRHAEPAEALLLACKKTKHDENFKGNSGMADIIQIKEKVFHYATTMGANASMDETIKEKVKNAILLRNKLKTIYKPQSSEHVQKTLKKKHVMYGRKYNVIGLPDSVGNGAGRSSQNHNSGNDNNMQLPVPTDQDPPSNSHEKSDVVLDGKDELNNLAPLLDVEEEAVNSSPLKSEDILCNSVKMFREKLHVSEPKQDDFVYDLYVCKKTPEKWNIQDILYVQPCKDLEFVYESEPAEETHQEDEDDSNDESNWRNDYPDEENDSIDEDEKRFLFDEEEDLKYDSDDCDPPSRNDDGDIYSSLFGSHSRYDDDTYDDADYGDDYHNDAMFSHLDDYATRDNDFNDYDENYDDF